MTAHLPSAPSAPVRRGPAARSESRPQESPVEVMMRALHSTLPVAQLDLLLDRIEATP